MIVDKADYLDRMLILLSDTRKFEKISYENSTIVIVDKADYLDRMLNLLSDTRKFEKINIKNEGILSFLSTKKIVSTIF